MGWLSPLARKQTVTAPNAGNFLADLSAIAPPAGQGAYAFMGDDGRCRGWVQFIPESGSQLIIHRLWTLQPGKGNGKHILRAVCDLADRHGVELILKTLPFGRKPYPLQKDHLKDWYERYGFVGNHKKMIRVPQPTLGGNTSAAAS
jgi:hypothetical protein